MKKIKSKYIGWVTEEELRELFDNNECIENDIREWLRDSGDMFVSEEMDELKDVMRFEIDSYDRVFIEPKHYANHCGEFASTVKNSIYSYPSLIEEPLSKLERYAEGVERLGGYIYDIPEHFEDAIDKQIRKVCDVYEKCFRNELEHWLYVSSDELFNEYFIGHGIDEWLCNHPEVCDEFYDAKYGVSIRHKKALQARKRMFKSGMRNVKTRTVVCMS